MLEFLLPAGFLDAEPPYWYAVVRPSDLSFASYDGEPRRAPPDAETRVVVFEPAGEGIEGGVFVSRYAASLGYITDSWYPTREAAITDVSHELGEELGPWTPVPESEDHPESYVLHLLARNRLE
ncbi:MAG: hypothetical protein JWO05_1041 [Gemmatimonadetes bacterium]|nr:hypothetical protein [Gemmatimonadota bacterium]